MPDTPSPAVASHAGRSAYTQDATALSPPGNSHSAGPTLSKAQIVVFIPGSRTGLGPEAPGVGSVGRRSLEQPDDGPTGSGRSLAGVNQIPWTAVLGARRRQPAADPGAHGWPARMPRRYAPLRYNFTMRYLIQFPAGTGDLILDALTPYVGNFKVHYRDDSAMIFDSQAAGSKVASIPFAKNSFVVVASTPRKGIDKGVGQLGRLAASAKFPPGSLRNSKFRTMIHIDGGLSAVDRNVKAGLDRSISRRTGQRVEPRGMCQEYWVIGRTDLGELLLCARLPKQKRAEKAKGAVSYELSSMLVAASRPSAKDIFLDPFAGSGSFVLARIKSGARQIWYSDINLQEFERGFPHELYSDKRVGFLDDDALVLSSVPDGQVDVIVTDPPWGEYDDVRMPYEEFVRAMVKSFSRVLNRAKGRFVVLASRKTATLVEGEFAKGGFSINSTHQILVNGHPATVLVGTRKQPERQDFKVSERRQVKVAVG